MIETRQGRDALERIGQVLLGRRLCRLALLGLMLAYGLAIFAPLLAGDRPYLLKAVDYRSYAAALRTLLPVSSSLERLLELGPAGYASNAMSWEQALDAELDAAEQRVELLTGAAPEASAPAFVAFRRVLEAAVSLARRGELQGALAAAREGKALAEGLRASQRARDPLQSAAGGLELKLQTSYPLLGTISGLEVFCMLLWCALASSWIWNPLFNRWICGAERQRIRRLRAPKLLAVLALCSGLAALWGVSIGGSAVFERAPFKQAIASGELQVTRAVFPPLAFGFAESHLGEIHRPPSWVCASRMTEDGQYEQRSVLPQAERGALTPVEVRYAEPARNAPWRHLLGTDSFGRDLLVRLLWGARVSLSVGLISALLVVLIGTLIGSLAGYFGGRIDFWISRLIEVVQCFPAFFLILLVLAFWDFHSVPPIFAIVVVMALVRWTSVARLARAEFLRLRETQFALAARAAGVSSMGIIFRHLLPNALGPVMVAGTFLVASGILTESALSFLGFGVQEPIPSWGSLINDSRSPEHWWIQLFPGLCIFLTVVSYNLIGEALRDALDPKLKS